MGLRGRTRNQRMTDARKHQQAGRTPKRGTPAAKYTPPPSEEMVIAGRTFAVTKDRTYIPEFGPLYTATAKLIGDNLPLPQAWCVWTGNGDTAEEALAFMKMKIHHEFE